MLMGWFWLSHLFAALAFSISSAFASETLDIDPSVLTPGQCLQKDWHTGIRHITLPVMVCRRTEQQLAALKQTPAAGDPKLLAAMMRSANAWGDSRLPSQMLVMRQRLDDTPSRSLRPEYFVAVQLEPYIGCQLDTDGFGKQGAAFRNPCHGNTFDSNGRPVVETGYFPYPQLFLNVPPHRWQGQHLLVGEMPSDWHWVNYDLRALDGEEGRQTQLFNAIAWGDIERIDALNHDRQSPVDIEIKPEQTRMTPLLFAIAKGQRVVVRWLLENGANPHVKTHSGTTALELADIVGDEKMSALLRQYLEAKQGPRTGEAK